MKSGVTNSAATLGAALTQQRPRLHLRPQGLTSAQRRNQHVRVTLPYRIEDTEFSLTFRAQGHQRVTSRGCWAILTSK